MKKGIFSILLIVIVIVGFSEIISQPRGDKDFPPDGRRPPRERFDQMEKLKLIEILEMDETTTLKFFSRRQESKTKFMKLGQQREELMDEIEQKFKKGDGKDDKFYKTKIDKILEIENKMLEERKSFIYSLDDILTKEQIMRFVIFEFRLKREIQDILRDKNR